MRPAWLLVSNALFFAGYLPFFVHGELLKTKPFRLPSASPPPKQPKPKTKKPQEHDKNNDQHDSKQFDPLKFFAYTPENYNDTKVDDFLAAWSIEIRDQYLAQNPPLDFATFYAKDLLSWDKMTCGIDECGCQKAPSLDYIRSKYPDDSHRAREIYFGIIAFDAYFKFPCVLHRAMDIAIERMQGLCKDLAWNFFHPSEQLGGRGCLFGQILGAVVALALVTAATELLGPLVQDWYAANAEAIGILMARFKDLVPGLASGSSRLMRTINSFKNWFSENPLETGAEDLAMTGANTAASLRQAAWSLDRIAAKLGPGQLGPVLKEWSLEITKFIAKKYLPRQVNKELDDLIPNKSSWNLATWHPPTLPPLNVPRASVDQGNAHIDDSYDIKLAASIYISASDVQNQNLLRKFCPLCTQSPVHSSSLEPGSESAGIANAVAYTEQSHTLGSINLTMWQDVATANPFPVHLRYFSGQHMGYSTNLGAGKRLQQRTASLLDAEDEKELMGIFFLLSDALSRDHRLGVMDVLSAHNLIEAPTKRDYAVKAHTVKRQLGHLNRTSIIQERDPIDYDQSPFEFSYPTELSSKQLFFPSFVVNDCGENRYRNRIFFNEKVCKEELQRIGSKFLSQMKEALSAVNDPEFVKAENWPKAQPAPFARSYKATFPEFPQLNVIRAWEHNIEPLAENMLKQIKATMASKAWKDQQCYVHCGGANYDHFFEYGNGHPDWQPSEQWHHCREVCWVSKDAKHLPLYGGRIAAKSPRNFNMDAVIPYSWGMYQYTPFNGIVPGGFTISQFTDNSPTNVHHVPILPVCDSPYSNLADTHPGHYKDHAHHDTGYPCFCGDVFGDHSQAFWDAGHFAGSRYLPGFEGQFRRCREDLVELLRDRPAAYLKVQCEFYYNNLYVTVNPEHDYHHYGANKKMCQRVMERWSESYMNTQGRYDDGVDEDILDAWRRMHQGFHDGHDEHQTMQHVNNDLKHRGCLDGC